MTALTIAIKNAHRTALVTNSNFLQTFRLRSKFLFSNKNNKEKEFLSFPFADNLELKSTKSNAANTEFLACNVESCWQNFPSIGMYLGDARTSMYYIVCEIFANCVW